MNTILIETHHILEAANQETQDFVPQESIPGSPLEGFSSLLIWNFIHSLYCTILVEMFEGH